MKDLQKIKEFFSKPVNEAIETPMDAIAFLNANKNEIIKLKNNKEYIDSLKEKDNKKLINLNNIPN